MDANLGPVETARVKWGQDLRDGMLNGAPAFLIGGGPSLRNVDTWQLAKVGAYRLACNVSYPLGCDAVIFGDPRAVELADSPPLRASWRSLQVPKILAGFTEKHAVSAAVLEQVTFLPAFVTWSHKLADGVLRCRSTGLAALNLLDILGAGRIYLLGFDFDGGPEQRTQNWHGHYPRDWRSNSSAYADMVKEFEYRMQDVRASVVNCNAGSRLRCFPFLSYEDALVEAADILGKR